MGYGAAGYGNDWKRKVLAHSCKVPPRVREFLDMINEAEFFTTSTTSSTSSTSSTTSTSSSTTSTTN